MLSRAQKEEQVSELRDKFGRATSVFVADYRGVTVPEINQLRSKIRGGGEGQYEFYVSKNSVLRRAVADTELDSLRECFNGPRLVSASRNV